MRPLDWLFPQRCVLCDRDGDALCAPCRADAVAALVHACPCCAIPLPAGQGSALCGRCLKRRPSFDASIAGATYEPPFDALVRDLKYRANLAFAPVLAALVAARATAATDAVSRLIPVPLARARMAMRGFNQSIEIARALSRRLSLPVDLDSVIRIHDTTAQAALPFEARRRNIRGAFAVVDAHRLGLAGATVAVVDDVMTTGSTLDEMATTLKRAGVARVINLVAARTP